MKRTLSFLLLLSMAMQILYANTDIQVEKNMYGYPLKSVNLKELRYSLLEKNYEKLNTIIETYQNEFLSDFHNEFKILDAMTAFEAPDQVTKNLLDEWVAKFPDFFQPYLARGCYYYNMGWESRGHKWANETEKEQFARMENYFSLAVADLNVALAIAPKLLVAYRFLIGISTANGERAQIAPLYEKAMEITPYSFYIHTSVMNALLPRWGGSYKSMDKFADEAQKHADVNPILRLLKGFTPADKANIEMQSRNYENAIKLYLAVLKEYKFWKFEYELANCFSATNKFVDALAYIDKAIESSPQTVIDYISLRIMILISRSKFDEATPDLNFINEVLPGTSAVRNITSRYYKQRGTNEYVKKNYAEAIAFFREAITQHVEDELLFRQIADIQLKLDDRQGAMDSFNEILKLNPKDFTSYYQIGDILYKMGKYDQALAPYGKALELYPKVKDIMFKAAYCRYRLEMYEEAAAGFSEIIKLYPESAESFFYWADSLLGLNRPEEALSVLNSALKDPRTSTDYIRFELGKAFLGLNDLESARKEYEYLSGKKAEQYAKDLEILIRQYEEEKN